MKLRMKVTIGTRGSPLALWQARHVAARVRRAHPELEVELAIIKTQGDKILDTPLALIGGKGLFTKEIEEALLDRRVDLAVHSMKDLPTELPDGLQLTAVLKREDPRDVFVSGNGQTLDQLAPGSRIGTSSLRRKAFLLSRFPHLEIEPIRGNVDTRLNKIHTLNLAGAVLAAAGIKRMEFSDRITSFLDPDLMIPAIGQGAMGVETRTNDPVVEEVVRGLNHPETEFCVQVERAFLRRMGGGCQVPMAAHAIMTGDGADVVAAVVHPDGNPSVKGTIQGPLGDVAMGTRLADGLIAEGADTILRQVLGADWSPGPA
ncbi:MAG: hydroxymethylbilane synthase [Thermodesulfobacteriota bacterium]